MTQNLVNALGMALVHFVWQGALIAVMTAGVLRALRGGSAQVRYAVACCALAGMLVVPVLTGLAAYGTARAPVAAAAAINQSSTVGDATLAHAMSRAGAIPLSERGGGVGQAPRQGTPLLAIAVAVWLTGVAVHALRLLFGWRSLQRLHRNGRPAPAEWQQRLRSLAVRLGVHTVVHLHVSAAAAVPMVLGWLRPVILLPPAALSGLSPQQLEAVLLHELAHISRHDHLVNLLQVATEVLLFYNPAVWWLSARIREEREHCCDDIASHASGDPVRYAGALLFLEEQRRGSNLALAANGTALLPRVRRLLAPPPPPRAAAWIIACMLTLSVLGAAAVAHARTPIVPSALGMAGTEKTAPAIFIVVGTRDGEVRNAAGLAAALLRFGVTAVYTTSDRTTIAAAEPLANLLEVARIPYDFGDQPDRFATHLLGSALMATLGRVAVVVLPSELVPTFITHASGGTATPDSLAADEVFLVQIPGSTTHVRISD